MVALNVNSNKLSGDSKRMVSVQPQIFCSVRMYITVADGDTSTNSNTELTSFWNKRTPVEELGLG